ncbi:Cytochrome P450 1A1 [Mactra antiquata]
MAFTMLTETLGYLRLDMTTILIVIVATLVIHQFLLKPRYQPPLPPSPMMSLPVIGHLYLLDYDVRKAFRKFRRRLGDVYSLQMGERLVIVISGYETLKEAFIKQGDNFNSRPRMFLTEKYFRRKGILLTSGDAWKEHRTFSMNTLKNFGMGKSFLEDKIHVEVVGLIEDMKKCVNIPVDPKAMLSAHVVNVISSMVFKGQFKHDDHRLVKMIDVVEDRIQFAAGVANFLPWLSKLPGDPLKLKKLSKDTEQMYEYAADIIADHEKDFNENDIDDLTSAYIHEMRRLKDAGMSTTMDYDHLTATINDLFMAGSHTVATTLRWSIPCLVQFSHIQEKLHKEIVDAIGSDKLPSMEDKPRLVYLEAFYLELLRYITLIITSGIHATSIDRVFKGFTIPHDAVILPDLDSVLHDTDIWGDPEQFRPERFVDEAGNLKKKDELIIFFLGKRNCLGESLARVELLLFLGALIQTFKFESCPGETLTVEKVDGKFGFAHTPLPYKVKITLR